MFTVIGLPFTALGAVRGSFGKTEVWPPFALGNSNNNSTVSVYICAALADKLSDGLV